jgi:1-pyrroline-5-carboxylate dehydrogenase
MWNNGFRDLLISETEKITVGPCTDFEHFVGPVIGRPAFERIGQVVEQAKKDGGEVIAGGSCRSQYGDLARAYRLIRRQGTIRKDFL